MDEYKWVIIRDDNGMYSLISYVRVSTKWSQDGATLYNPPCGLCARCGGDGFDLWPICEARKDLKSIYKQEQLHSKD